MLQDPDTPGLRSVPTAFPLPEMFPEMFYNSATENHRQIKANDSYYLLKKTAVPIVIVECGFLSNREEAQKLCEESYQEKIAWQIHLGIMQYLNKK